MINIAVSKTKPVSMIETIYQAGVREFGENKVQELCEKAAFIIICHTDRDVRNSEDDYEEESDSAPNRQQTKAKSTRQNKIIPMRGTSTSEKQMEVWKSVNILYKALYLVENKLLYVR